MNKWIPTKTFTNYSLRILLPVIMGQVLLTAVYFLDNFMASPLGDAGISAVGSANEFIFIVSTFLIGFSIMVDIVAAQYFGANKMEKFHESIRVKFKLIFYIGTALTIIMIAFPGQLMGLFNLGGGNEEMVKIGTSYLRLMAVSNFIWIFTQVISSTLSVIGKTKYTLYIAIISIVFNFTFNFLFVNVWHMGADGLAYSTIGSRIFELLFFFYFLYINREKAWGGWSLHSSQKISQKILKNWQVALGQLIWSIGLAAQTIVWSAYYDTEVLAGVFFAYAIAGIMFTAFSAVHVGVKVIVGQTLGTGDFDKAKKESNMLLIIVMGIALGLTVITLVVGYAIPWDTVIENGTVVTRDTIRDIVGAFSLALPFFILTNFSFSHLEAAGYTKMSTILDRYIQLGVLVPVAWILCEYTDLSLIWVFVIITNVINVIPTFAWPVYLKYTWLKNITEDEVKGQLA